MTFVKLNKSNIKKYKLNIFTEVIYQNFIYAKDISHLKHNKNEIYNLLTHDDTHINLYIVDNKIGGYLIGKIMKLNDGRNVYYVSYLYIGETFRQKGLAKKFLSIVDKTVNELNLDGVLLTCDTHNKKAHDLYLKNGFMPDMLLRNYTQFEILFK
jgi:RimJ/RimL family protein N-acetyltransferase